MVPIAPLRTTTSMEMKSSLGAERDLICLARGRFIVERESGMRRSQNAKISSVYLLHNTNDQNALTLDAKPEKQ